MVIVQIRYDAEDSAVGLVVEVVLADLFDCLPYGAFVKEHCAEDALLRLTILRGDFWKGRLFFCGHVENLGVACRILCIAANPGSPGFLRRDAPGEAPLRLDYPHLQLGLDLGLEPDWNRKHA
ncbi:MAG: hypothetical protein Kow0099_27010 [Candidatus Abyssubacteria bacterium]